MKRDLISQSCKCENGHFHLQNMAQNLASKFTIRICMMLKKKLLSCRPLRHLLRHRDRFVKCNREKF